jgi:hypothetical protein
MSKTQGERIVELEQKVLELIKENAFLKGKMEGMKEAIDKLRYHPYYPYYINTTVWTKEQDPITAPIITWNGCVGPN